MASSSLVLASASPRRQQLLAQIGVACIVAPQHIDESRHAGEAPRDYVQRLAREKAQAALATAPAAAVVLGSDTIVLCGDELMGKPRDKAEAMAMLLKLAGRSHQVLTAVAVANSTRFGARLSSTRVTFRAISPAEAQAYWDSGEPQGKAGAYGIQGLAAVFVEAIEGSYSGVMGLPLFETAALLQEFGIACWNGKENSP